MTSRTLDDGNKHHRLLLLDLDGTLVRHSHIHSSENVTCVPHETSRICFATRANAKRFVEYASISYDIGIFTTAKRWYAEAAVHALGITDYVESMYSREDCEIGPRGRLSKNLEVVNRDLADILLIDNDPHHVVAFPSNVMWVDDFIGIGPDHALEDLTPFLIDLASEADAGRRVREWNRTAFERRCMSLNSIT